METKGQVSRFSAPPRVKKWLEVACAIAGDSGAITLSIGDGCMNMRAATKSAAVHLYSDVDSPSTASATATRKWYAAGKLSVTPDGWEVDGRPAPTEATPPRFPSGQVTQRSARAEVVASSSQLVSLARGLVDSTGIETLAVMLDGGTLRLGGESAHNVNTAEITLGAGAGCAATSVAAAAFSAAVGLLVGDVTVIVEDRKSVTRLTLRDETTAVEFDTRVAAVIGQPELPELLDSRRHDVTFRNTDLWAAFASALPKSALDTSALVQLRLGREDDGSTYLNVHLISCRASGPNRNAVHRVVTLPCTTSDYFEADIALPQLLGLLAMARHTRGSITLRAYDPYINLMRITAYGTSTHLGRTVRSTCVTVGRRPSLVPVAKQFMN